MSLQPDLDLLRSEIKRMTRLFSREELPDKIADFVKENYDAKLPDEYSPLTRPSGDHSKAIITMCLEYYGFRFEQLAAPGRKREMVEARRMIMYLLSTKTRMGCTKIGAIFNRDHTTVIHQKRKTVSLMRKEAYLKSEVVAFMNEIALLSKMQKAEA